MASLVTRVTGLCLAFAAFSFAAEKVRQPLLEMVQKQTLLDDIVAALEAWVETTLGRTGSGFQHGASVNGGQCGEHCSRVSHADSDEWEIIEIDPADLCTRCTDSRKTIHELERMSQRMGISYPGDPFEPCQLCRERARSLLKLERRLSSLSEAQRHNI